MYRHALYVQSSSRQRMIHQGVIHTARGGDFDDAFVAVAYATKKGAEALHESLLGQVESWEDAQKHWLVSIDFGLTEPEALTYLANLPNSHVRVPRAQEVLRARLRPRVCFHPKVYFFGGDTTTAVFSGSANLTLSGLFLNDEQGAGSIWEGRLSRSQAAACDNALQQRRVLENVFDAAAEVDDVLAQYQARWRPRKGTREDATDAAQRIIRVSEIISADKAAALATATHFWTEINYVVENLGPGRPGNQIDLQRGSRIFFGLHAGNVPRNTVLGQVRLRYRGHVDDYSFRYGDNSMDKLNLPIPGGPGPARYSNRTLLFTKQLDGTFTLEIGTPRQIARWRRMSQEQGTFYQMRRGGAQPRGREFGVFS